MIDFRSDVLGGVSPSVLRAMTAAATTPPGFALGEDPHQNALEETIADAFGFQAALFTPTCTMANQIAVRLFCRDGDVIVADSQSHVAVNEVASTTVLNRARLAPVETEHGHFGAAALAAAWRAASDPAQIALVWTENTHNRSGGTIMPDGWLGQIGTVCQRLGLPVHLDGSRIWNAAVASGRPLDEIAAGADTLAVSLNKGLGAACGGLLLGARDVVREAAALRKLFGGWWRPTGMLAAAALQAYRDHRERIERDHERAVAVHQRLAERFDGQPVRVVEPQTNIVMIGFPGSVDVDRLLGAMRQRGVLASKYGAQRIRLVLHANIGHQHVEPGVAAIADAYRDVAGDRARAASPRRSSSAGRSATVSIT